MTYKDKFALPTRLREQVAKQGLDFPPELIRFLINTSMQVERRHQAFAARIYSERLFKKF
jgi:hypothetical protein